MKLHTYYDDNYQPLFRNFRDTLKDDYEVVGVKTDPINDAHNYLGYLQKPILVQQWIKENMGDIILVSDCDVQFFDKTKPIIDQFAPRHEIVLQRGEPRLYQECNIGFMSIQCSERTLVFWQMIERLVREHKAQDEALVNASLKVCNITWGLFPETIWRFQKGTLPPEDIVLHHATWAAGVDGKLRQMAEVRAYLDLRG